MSEETKDPSEEVKFIINNVSVMADSFEPDEPETSEED